MKQIQISDAWTNKALKMIKKMNIGDMLTLRECFIFFQEYGKNYEIKNMCNIAMNEGFIRYIKMGKTIYIFRIKEI